MRVETQKGTFMCGMIDNLKKRLTEEEMTRIGFDIMTKIIEKRLDDEKYTKMLQKQDCQESKPRRPWGGEMVTKNGKQIGFGWRCGVGWHRWETKTFGKLHTDEHGDRWHDCIEICSHCHRPNPEHPHYALFTGGA